MHGRNKPILAITQGDPAGIGPEIIAAGWSKLVAESGGIPVVFGDPETLRAALDLRKIPASIQVLESLQGAMAASPEIVPCFSCVNAGNGAIVPGTLSAAAGEAAFAALTAAIRAVQCGHADAIVTAPLNKESLHMAGHHYPGHTEILAESCGVRNFAMMLYLGAGEPLSAPHGLAVVHVTLHTAMRTIFEQITIESVSAKIRLADDFMTKIKHGEKPRIGICSLNPHAGEGGLFGDEELTRIRPAIELALKSGMNVEGPFPADSIMLDAKNGRFDAVVAMFHDQGHIAIKLLDRQRSVNVTLGLPIIRTSVAHGTAFDIAWKGIAEPGSLIEAARVAVRLAEQKK